MPNIVPGAGTSAAVTADSTPTSRRIDTTAPLYGGGDLSADRTLYINTDELLGGYARLAGSNVFTGEVTFLGPVNLAPSQYPTTFGGMTISGELHVLAGAFNGWGNTDRYLASGEFSASMDQFARRRETNYFTQPNVFSSTITVSGAGTALGTFGVSGATAMHNRLWIRSGPLGGIFVSRGSETPNVNSARFDDNPTTTAAVLQMQHQGAGEGILINRVGATGPVVRFGDYLRIEANGDTQISGTVLGYGPMYQGKVDVGARYIVSGELGTGAAADTALRGSVNYFSQNNIFGANVTVSGALTHAVDGRYMASGELGAQNFAKRAATNWFTSTNTFTGITTFSGAVSTIGGVTSLPAGTTEAYALTAIRTDARNDSAGSEKAALLAQQDNPFDLTNRALRTITAASGGVAIEAWERTYTSYPSISGDASTFRLYGRGGFVALSDCQISGQTIVSQPIWHRSQASPGNRYLTSGELNAGAGSGDFVKAASNFVTGTSQVFGPATTVQLSGLTTYGSAGGTRMTPTGGMQVSGTDARASIIGYQGAIVYSGLRVAAAQSGAAANVVMEPKGAYAIGYITTSTVDATDDQSVQMSAASAVDVTRGAYMKLFGNEYIIANGLAILGGGYSTSIETGVILQASGVSRLIVNSYGTVRPDTAGTQNFGTATHYWGELNYKTLTDRGCLGWMDEGVELPDGRIVSDSEAIMSIQKHPSAMTVYGIPMLDYSTFPKASYKPAPIATEDTYETVHTSEGPRQQLLARAGEKIGVDGVEMTSMFSLMIGTLRELTQRTRQIERVIASGILPRLK